jgi:hypothetical protein
MADITVQPSKFFATLPGIQKTIATDASVLRPRSASGGSVSTTPLEVQPQPVGLSQVERVTNTFFEPSKTMADIRRSTSWWLPWLLISIFSVAVVFTWDKKIGFDNISQVQISKSSRADQFEKLPPDQKQKQLDMQIKATRGFSYASPIFILLFMAICAAGLMAVMNFGMGAKLSFSTMMAIVAYSWLPGIISAVLTIVVSFLADPEGYDIQKPLMSNPGYFIDHPKFLSGMLTMFDIFMIWTIYLMAIGVSENSKIKKGNAFIAICVTYFVYKLIASGLGAAFS